MEVNEVLSHRDVTRVDSRKLVFLCWFLCLQNNISAPLLVAVRLLSRPSNAKQLHFSPARLLSSKQMLSRRLCIYGPLACDIEQRGRSTSTRRECDGFSSFCGFPAMASGCTLHREVLTYIVWKKLRACVNDVPKIKIGKNQNQNWALIGRGLKPPDYASLFFGNRCQTKEVPRDLMFIFRKINIGGVHLIEGFPNATRQRPEHSRVTTAARRHTAPPHNTHNFCWHGPRQRSHGEGNR